MANETKPLFRPGHEVTVLTTAAATVAAMMSGPATTAGWSRRPRGRSSYPRRSPTRC